MREFSRKTKAKGGHHHQTGLTKNVKGTSLAEMKGC